MCGITGIFNLNGEPVSSVVLRKMTDEIAHRGPDGEGFYSDSFIGLAHRRLAIIDLSPAAHQPMMTPDGQYTLIFNGEIYNFQELRLELEAKGCAFRSRSDSEVVLYAYAIWGEACLQRFNGMFAFAVWDRKRQELFLARDRFGIKPLYYTLAGSAFLFASEIKSLLAHPSCRTELDREALVEYFTFQNIFTDRTLFSGVHLLPAATFMRVPLAANSLPTGNRWWDYSFAEPEKAWNEAEYAEELDCLLRQAVSRQLVSDVDLGAYLSGGMDSGTITAIASEQLPYIKSFTCGFDLVGISGDELLFDERLKSERMSHHFRSEQYEMVLKAGDMERIMPRLSYHLDEPRLGQSYPNAYIAQLASKFVKVVLSGTGGDELFGGYPWRYYHSAESATFDEYIDRYYAYWQRLIPNSVLQSLLQPIWSDVKHVWTRDIFASVFYSRRQQHGEVMKPEDYVHHSLYFEAKTFLHGLFVVEDKLSMAYGLETRVPFMDNDLVNFAMRLPVKLKVANFNNIVRINENEAGHKSEKYYQRTNDGKVLLRNVMKKYIPLDVIQSPKQGFSAPDASWFRGDSREYIRKEILNPKANIYQYLDRDVVSGLVEEHLGGTQNRRLLIWSLLSFEWWLRRFEGNCS